MDIIKCDKCRKTKIDKDKKGWARISISGIDVGFLSYDLCEKCGKGILNILKKNFKEKKK